MPHHTRSDEWCQYREGVSFGFVQTASHRDGTPRKKFKKERAAKPIDDAELEKFANTTLIDAGFPVGIPVDIPPMTRVTLKFEQETAPEDFPYPREYYSEGGEQPRLLAEAVNPASPREDAGYYWGYSLRQASTLSAIFTECPFEDGYDVSIGTSERGKPTWDILSASSSTDKLPSTFKHALIVFGGVAGLEVAAAADKELSSKGIGKDNLADLFDYYVNVCPGQGSRTIRTEEAVWIALGQLRPWTAGVTDE
jgi:predicted SPOUT superfamily RNA methylase MTH1